MVPLELGSDIGGSLRCPAHFCGVFSHKPSLDLVPQRGAGPPQTQAYPTRGDLAVIGPMARNAADLALELDVLAGPDEEAEGVGYRLALPAPRHNRLADFRILVIDAHPLRPTAQRLWCGQPPCRASRQARLHNHAQLRRASLTWQTHSAIP
jgi:amidase